MRNGERKRKREIFPEVKSRDSAGFRHCLPPPFSDFFGNGFIAIIRKSFLLGFPPPRFYLFDFDCYEIVVIDVM